MPALALADRAATDAPRGADPVAPRGQQGPHGLVPPAVVVAGIALIALIACVLLAPAVVNGDGLGYLRATPGGELVPGHLAILPLLRALAALTGRTDPLSLLGPARVLCWLSAAVAVAALAVAAARLAGTRAAIVAALGMAGSSGFLEAGADLESYAPALAAMCLSLAAGVWRARGGGVIAALACALFAALSALLHIENVLFVPVAILLCAGPSAHSRVRPRALIAPALLVGGTSAVMIVGAYALAAHLRGDDLLSALRWIRGASHGFSYPLGWTSPLITLYGVAKTLLYAPYHYEAPWWLVITCTVGGLIAAATMAWLATRPGRPRTLGPLISLAWALPFAAVGALYFSSDSERWVFLLPPAWLVVGAGASTSPRAHRAGVFLVGALLACNLAMGIPRAHDASRRERADAVTARLAPGDLVISPGHSWDEYVGFYRPLDVHNYPMIFFCGQLGGAEPMAADLRRRITWARDAGHAVWLLRADEDEGAPGWKDLAHFGVTSRALEQVIPGHRVAVAPGLERVDP